MFDVVVAVGFLLKSLILVAGFCWLLLAAAGCCWLAVQPLASRGMEGVNSTSTPSFLFHSSSVMVALHMES